MTPSSSSFDPSPPLTRRAAIKWVLTAAAAMTLRDRVALTASAGNAATARGYGTDPDLQPSYRPGELWPLTLTPEQRAVVAALCDLIIPADEFSPSASAVGVPDFIDEWISAPYSQQRADREPLLEGCAWLDTEARRRHRRGFASLDEKEQTALVLPISSRSQAAAADATRAAFFERFRDLVAGGFYTTPAGMRDIGYVGNMPLAEFAGPPPEVLKRLGLS